MRYFRVIILTLIIFGFFNNNNYIYAEDKNEIKLRINWYVFNQHQNYPVKDVYVYIEKNNSILWKTITNKEGYYDFTIDNVTDFVNLCIEANIDSSIPGVNYCVTQSAFQKIWRFISWVELREISYNFYTNSKWENLNEILTSEKYHESYKESFNEYESILIKKREEERIQQAEVERMQQLKTMKEKYRMPANPELSWPLKEIHVIWVVQPKNKEDNVFKTDRVYITLYDHKKNILDHVELNEYNDYNIIVRPKNEDVFLHPIVMKIENKQTIKKGKNYHPIYKKEYRLLTNDKNIENIYLEDNTNDSKIKTTIIRENIPFIAFILITLTWLIFIITIIKRKQRIKIQDY